MQIKRLQGDVEGALVDLNAAITACEALLASGDGVDEGTQASCKRTLQQAYLQRSILFAEKAGCQSNADADLAASAAYGNRLARMMTMEVRRPLPCATPLLLVLHLNDDGRVVDVPGEPVRDHVP